MDAGSQLAASASPFVLFTLIKFLNLSEHRVRNENNDNNTYPLEGVSGKALSTAPGTLETLELLFIMYIIISNNIMKYFSYYQIEPTGKMHGTPNVYPTLSSAAAGAP